MEQKKKPTTGRIIYNLFQIFVIGIIAYMTMVFISHFSVYNANPDYKVADSFKAMLFKTEVPSEFFVYFYIFVIVTVLLALFIHFFLKLLKKEN